MNYYSEQDIREIVAGVLAQSVPGRPGTAAAAAPPPIPVEISARHVHLTQAAADALFGRGHGLTVKRPLSQPGQFLAQERVRAVSLKGELSNLAVLGPIREYVQVELSLTDAKTLGLQPPINLSGDLDGAADVVLIGPEGVWHAPGSVIAAKAHIHMTSGDARTYGTHDGQRVAVRLDTRRGMTLDDVIVRVREDYALAIHVDFDEANAAALDGPAAGVIVKDG